MPYPIDRSGWARQLLDAQIMIPSNQLGVKSIASEAKPLDLNARPLILPEGMEYGVNHVEPHDSDLMFAAQDTGLFLENWLGPSRRVPDLFDNHSAVIGSYRVTAVRADRLVLNVAKYGPSPSSFPAIHPGLPVPSLAARRQWYAVLRAAVPIRIGSEDRRRVAVQPYHWEPVDRIAVDKWPVTEEDLKQAAAASYQQSISRAFRAQSVMGKITTSVLDPLSKNIVAYDEMVVDPTPVPEELQRQIDEMLRTKVPGLLGTVSPAAIAPDPTTGSVLSKLKEAFTKLGRK